MQKKYTTPKYVSVLLFFILAMFLAVSVFMLSVGFLDVSDDKQLYEMSNIEQMADFVQSDILIKIFFIIFPLLPFIFFYLYFGRSFYEIEINDDKIKFKKIFKEGREYDINDLKGVYPFFPKLSLINGALNILSGTGVISTAPILTFHFKNKEKIDVINNIIDITELLDYLKSKKQNLEIKDEWAIVRHKKGIFAGWLFK